MKCPCSFILKKGVRQVGNGQHRDSNGLPMGVKWREAGTKLLSPIIHPDTDLCPVESAEGNKTVMVVD